MTASDLLTALRGQGFTVAPFGAGLRVRPASRVTSELRAGLIAHKADLLALLKAESTSAGDPVACPDCGGPMDRRAPFPPWGTPWYCQDHRSCGRVVWTAGAPAV